ncbi:MAG: hypothetical protein IPO92_12625 [Saprospiraceae bacterium]|nr:hypothetical protein [Saprospiraceae bacterium]
MPNPGTFPIPTAVVATHDGVWQVTVTDANGCTATDNITITVDPSPLNTCANATTLIDNAAPINGTTACASAFSTGFCGLNTTTSHTVFYRYTVPAVNTTNTNIVFTVAPNNLTTGIPATDLNIGLFTSCAGAPYTTTTVGDLCNPTAGLVTITCVAPGTMLLIAIGSSDTNDGDFSITIDETNAGIPVNDLCTSPTPVTFTADCDLTAVTGNTLNACPESFVGSGCALNNFPTIWYQAVLPAGGVGFGFENLTGNPNINVFNNNCASLTQFGACITAPSTLTPLTPGTYLIAVRNTDPGAVFTFDIKTIIPPANDLCPNGITLSDNVQINGTTSCATPFSTAYCSLNTTSSHTVFYRYTVPAGNTTNTNLDFTILTNTATRNSPHLILI